MTLTCRLCGTFHVATCQHIAAALGAESSRLARELEEARAEVEVWRREAVPVLGGESAREVLRDAVSDAHEILKLAAQGLGSMEGTGLRARGWLTRHAEAISSSLLASSSPLPETKP